MLVAMRRASSRPDQMAEAAKEQRSEILLITDDKTVLLDMGHDGKFSAKSASWEENKVILPGDEIVNRVDGGRWFIVKRPAQGAIIGAGYAGGGRRLRRPRLTMFCNVVTGGCCAATVAPQPALRCNLERRCAATSYFARSTHWSLTKSATASSRRFRSVEAASA